MTKDSFMSMAIYNAERLLTANSELMKLVRNKNDFKYASGKGVDVVSGLLNPVAVEVYYYRPWNPWSSVIGYTDGVSIYVNSRNKLLMRELVANLVHEYSHIQGYTHGDNYPSEEKNLYSVPYFLSTQIENGNFV
jgi:hypothetical protein